jgi:hypothetical protein
MKFSNSRVSFLSAAAILILTASSAAQSSSRSSTIYKSYGNSNAGVIAIMSTGLSVSKTRSSTKFTRSDRLNATATGSASADLRFLGSRKRAGHFRIDVGATGVVTRNLFGRYLNSSCSHTGSVYLRVGGTTLWNWSLGRTFGASVNYRIRIMTPTLIVPMPAGALVLRGQAYGRMHGSVTAAMYPCAGFASLNGNMSISGNGTATVSVYSLLFAASVKAIFSANDQRLELRDLRVAPGISGWTWGVMGSVYFHSGSMAGYIHLKAVLPPYIPVSKLLANWTRGASITKLL